MPVAVETAFLQLIKAAGAVDHLTQQREIGREIVGMRDVQGSPMPSYK